MEKKCNILNFIKFDNVMNLFIYLTIIVMPFILNKYVNQSYLYGKVTFLYIVAILLAIFGVIYGIKKLIKIDSINIRWEILTAIFFLFTIFVAAIFSNNRQIALIGSEGRKEGFVMYCIYILLFIVSSYVFKINYKIIKVVLFFPCIMSIYGVLQYFKIDPIQKLLWGEILMEGQAIGTIGNANFFSTYICIFLFISTALYIFKKEKIYLAYTLILFIGMIASQTRGGWLAYIIYLIIGLIFILKRKDCLKRAGILLIVFIIGFCTLSMVKGSNTIEKASIQNVTNSKGTVAQRIGIYKLAFKMIKDKPLLGNGPDTFGYRLQSEYFNEYIEYIKEYNHYLDKCHNEILEYAANDGCLTAVLYLLLLGIIVVWLFKNRENDVNKILLLTVIGYFLQSLSNIGVVQVAPLFWILLGYCVKRKYDYDSMKNNNILK